MRPVRAVRRADLAWTLLTLLAVLAWDWSDADRWVSHLWSTTAGFPWRNAWLTRDLLHEGGRVAAGLVLLALVVDAVRCRFAPDRDARPGPDAGERWRALAVVVGGLVLVPLIKRVSDTSCPWDLAEFGGVVPWVSHWQLGLTDGGPGHCFPSGHAVAAFAFFALYFLWRPYSPARARWWLIGTLVAGTLLGGAQVLRGAHFVSHVLWSAWICWALAVATNIPLWRPLRRPSGSVPT